MSDILDRLRRWGWMVAVHNDYRQGGEFRTFWLLTHSDGRWVKGEGRHDVDALMLCQEQASGSVVCQPWCGGPRRDVPPGTTPIGYRDEQVFCSSLCIRVGEPIKPARPTPEESPR